MEGIEGHGWGTEGSRGLQRTQKAWRGTDGLGGIQKDAEGMEGSGEHGGSMGHRGVQKGMGGMEGCGGSRGATLFLFGYLWFFLATTFQLSDNREI